jgi:D-xylose transport system permease protein
MSQDVAPKGSTAAVAPPTAMTISESASEYIGRLRGGDLGSLPAVLGLVSLIVVFTVLKGETFFSVGNFANLLNQGAAVIVIAMGLIFVLLLGEIDLSAGFAAGTCGAILAVQLTRDGRPWPIAVALALLAGVAIGLAIGLLVARLGVPSFVVTLAFFLGLQGIQLTVIGQGGTIPINNDQILAIMNDNMPIVLGWALFVLVVAGYGAVTYANLRRRRKADLPTEAISVWAAKLAVLAVLLGIATAFLSEERSINPQRTSIKGVPWVVPVILILLVVLTYVLQQTRFGAHIYAVGGNAEAARRAGIKVKNLKTTCFVICSTLAAFAGILLVSRDNSVSPSTGGSVTLLYAVAAAVIGGTSLFGGRGRIKDAILGGLVLAVIGNGLPLVTSDAGIQFVVTGLVLLLAASVDALSRKRAAATGRI